MTYAWPVLLRPARVLVCSALLLSARNASAGTEDWQLSEVHLASLGDPQLRFVELVNLDGGCLFPSSTVDLYDAAGTLVDTMGLTVATSCFGAPTYLLLSTPEAAAYFGVTSDANLSSELPSSGQLCFASSATKYDCVRWGTISQPLVDLFGSSDTSSALSPSDSSSLSRVLSTHVVIDDWSESSPTPRQPNDGTIWEEPDAGPMPDAAPIADAAPPPDAARRSDAGPRPDARSDAGSTRYLDLDTVGGADCGCSSTGSGGLSSLLVLILALLPMRRRRPIRATAL